MPPRHKRSRLKLLLLLAVGLLVSAEIVVRVGSLVEVNSGVATPDQAAFNSAGMFAVVDDARRYANKPGASTKIGKKSYTHDARGQRVTPNPRPKKDVVDVMFLGDSTTYGLGVTATFTLPALTSKELNGRIRAHNLGVCGYTTAQEVATYEALRDQTDPELVVLVVYPNDYTRGAFRWDDELGVLYMDALPLVPESAKPILWRSALYRAVVSKHTDGLMAEGWFSTEERENWERTWQGVERLSELVRADGRLLLVALLPAMERLDPYLFEAQTSFLRERCEEHGLPVVDLLESLLAARLRMVAAFESASGKVVDEGIRAHFLSRFWVENPTDHHQNQEANKIASRQLAARIATILDQ